MGVNAASLPDRAFRPKSGYRIIHESVSMTVPRDDCVRHLGRAPDQRYGDNDKRWAGMPGSASYPSRCWPPETNPRIRFRRLTRSTATRRPRSSRISSTVPSVVIGAGPFFFLGTLQPNRRPSPCAGHMLWT